VLSGSFERALATDGNRVEKSFPFLDMSRSAASAFDAERPISVELDLVFPIGPSGSLATARHCIGSKKRAGCREGLLIVLATAISVAAARAPGEGAGARSAAGGKTARPESPAQQRIMPMSVFGNLVSATVWPPMRRS
jgi:hypothetical protein